MITFRWAHKWIGIVLGGVLLLWLITGIWIVLPERHQTIPPEVFTDWSAAPVSPAAAVAVVSPQDPTRVQALRLWNVAGLLFYHLARADGSGRLVDATTGTEVQVTAELAERVARAQFGVPEAPLASTELLEEHSARYAAGPLPVYRLTFDDADHTVAYIALLAGVVQGGGSNHRVRALVAGLHAFYPLRVLVGSKGEQGLLVLTGTITIVLVITGYWLGLPARWRRKFARKQA